MGLPISRTIVEIHEGRLWAKNIETDLINCRLWSYPPWRMVFGGMTRELLFPVQFVVLCLTERGCENAVCSLHRS
jgi:hypothetical protein